MDRIKRNERLAVMTRILTGAPNRIFTLSYFCELFGAAKSTMSEDIDILRDVMDGFSLGRLETVAGAAGGVRYLPLLTKSAALEAVQTVCNHLSSPGRVLAGGFLYMADLLAMPDLMEQMGTILASQFYKANPDFVLTVETKGIPLALMTARALHVPLVIARHDSKVYEGPAVNINYLSANGRVETMSLSRRAVHDGQRALIIDDFMKAGGTAKGMMDLMREFAVTVVGTGILLATRSPEKKRVSGAKTLMLMEEMEDERTSARVSPAGWLTIS